MSNLLIHDVGKNLKARLQADAESHGRSDVLDISVRGARIGASKQLRERKSIRLYFIPEGGEKITIAGLVVRAAARAANRYDYGVKFSEVMLQCDLRALICRKVVEQKFCD